MSIILYMGLKFLTPKLVWDKYDPEAGNLEASILSNTQDGHISHTKYCFTSETTRTGKVRASIDVYFDSRWLDKRPAIIVNPTLEAVEDYEGIARVLVGAGFVVGIVDYAKCFSRNDEDMSFPPELDYAVCPKCREYMYDIKTSAKETPWFVWGKIIRRAITFLKEHRLVQGDRIGIMGLGTGSHLTWIVAGIDNRVHACLPIDTGGYLWCRDRKRFGGNGIVPLNDEESAFSTGVGAETYARTITCPILFVCSSNSEYFDIDRCGDTFASIPSDNKHMLINQNANGQLTQSALTIIQTWLKKYLAKDEKSSQNPTISFEVIEGELCLRVNTIVNTSNIKAYITTSKVNSAVRTWTEITDWQKSGQSEYFAKVPVFDNDEYVIAYATVTYSKTVAYSTPVIGILPEKYDLAENTVLANKQSRVIYSGSMDKGIFMAETTSFVLDDDTIQSLEGPFGIKGVKTKTGNLVMFRNSYEHFSSDKNIIFRFDAYSSENRTFTLSLYSLSNKRTYSTNINIKGGNYWTAISLNAQDFKDPTGKSLVRFSDIDKFIFINAEDILFTNMLWV